MVLRSKGCAPIRFLLEFFCVLVVFRINFDWVLHGGKLCCVVLDAAFFCLAHTCCSIIDSFEYGIADRLINEAVQWRDLKKKIKKNTIRRFEDHVAREKYFSFLHS